MKPNRKMPLKATIARGERPEGPPPEYGAVIERNADNRERAPRPREACARDVDRQQAHQRRADEINGEVGQDLPVRRVHRRKRRVARPEGQHVKPRQMIGIIEDRRHIDQEERRQDRKRRAPPAPATRPRRALVPSPPVSAAACIAWQCSQAGSVAANPRPPCLSADAPLGNAGSFSAIRSAAAWPPIIFCFFPATASARR